MIGVAIALMAQAATLDAPPPTATDPILVIGRRLQEISVKVGQGPDGKWYCGMDGSTGRISLDKKLCKAVTKCVRKGASSDAAVRECVATTKRGLLRRLERERARR